MLKGDLLFRQVHPQFYQNGRLSDKAFHPTSADKGRLSVADSGRTTAEIAWRSRTADPKKKSAGTAAVSVAEVSHLGMVADWAPIDPNDPDDPHSEIAFPMPEDRKVWQSLALGLADAARRRGFVYGPIAG